MKDPKASSTPASYFEKIYKQNPDPWGYDWKLKISRYYEQIKYIRTLLIIPRKKYKQALEIGCSIGVFSKMLSKRCENLLAIDYSATALSYARERCKKASNIRFEERMVPQQFPEGQYDLITMAEVAYYLSVDDFKETMHKIINSLTPSGYYVMVHWRWFVEDLPVKGEDFHKIFIEESSGTMVLVKSQLTKRYRIDLFQKL